MHITPTIPIPPQIGFTAESGVSRSSEYATDFAKTVGAPVLHVNGEDMRAVLLAAKIATDYWAAFRKDVVVDLVGWRRNGHNEVDEPSFTNPLLYAAITGRASFPERYAASLVAAEGGAVAAFNRDALVSKLNAFLEAEFSASKSAFTLEGGTLGVGAGSAVVGDGSAFGGPHWGGMRLASAEDLLCSPDTGVDSRLLREVGTTSVSMPPGFKLHDRLARSHVAPRLEALRKPVDERVIDWGTAEALAFGSLLRGGAHVRLSGQDVERGTFSQRHALVVDQTTGARHVPLAAAAAVVDGGALSAGGGRFSPVSSLLSEFAVSGVAACMITVVRKKGVCCSLLCLCAVLAGLP